MRNITVPMRLSAAFATGLILLSIAPGFAQERRSGEACREMRTLDAMEYWFWDTYSGFTNVLDIDRERVGHLAIDQGTCIRIALVTLDNPQQKNAGIRQAVNELIMWVADDTVDEDDAERAADRLERITGEDFDTYAEWVEWWEPRSDFVFWSEEESRLVVLTSAMEAGETIYNEAMVLTAEEYWFYIGRGWVSESAAVGGYVLGEVVIPPHDYSFRVDVAELDDQGAKERGFRRALENLVVDGLLSPDLRGESLDAVIKQIAALTEESYTDRESWVAWWNANGDRLVLSTSTGRLVVR